MGCQEGSDVVGGPREFQGFLDFGELKYTFSKARLAFRRSEES